MSPAALRRQIGQLLDRRLQRASDPRRAPGTRQGVRSRRRHSLRAQHRRAGAGRRVGVRGVTPGAGSAALGVGRSGGRARRAAQGAVHRMAADGDARPQRRRRARGALRARTRGGAESGRHHARLRAGARHSYQSEESRSSATARSPSKAEEVAQARRRDRAGLQREGIAACGKHFPGHGDTATDSHLELPLVEHPPDRLRAVEFVPFRAAIEARSRPS